MKGLNHASALVAALFLFALVPLHAQVITWTGGAGGSTDVSNNANWSTPLVGDGTDDVFFGNSAQYFVDTPIGGAQLHDITFGDNEREDYMFGGTWPLAFNGNLTVATAGGDVTFNSSLQIYLSNTDHGVDIVDGVTVTVNGSISDATFGGSITKNGAGTLVLSGPNQFNGGLTVSAGTLALGSSSHLQSESTNISDGPVGTGTLTLNVGTTLSTAGIDDVTLHNDISLPGEGSGSVTFALSNTHTYNHEDYFYDGLTLSGALSGNGAIDLYGDGNSHDGMHNGGNLTLNGDNSGWSGGLNIFGDNLVTVNNDNGLGTGMITFSCNSAGVVDFNNTSIPAIGGLSGGFSYYDGEIFGSKVVIGAEDSEAVLTINQDVDTEFAGRITGLGHVVKAGEGTLTLSGVSDFSGGLTIDSGTLVLGSSSYDFEGIQYGPVGTGSLTIQDHATLAIADGGGITLDNDLRLRGEESIATVATGTGDLTLNGRITEDDGAINLIKTGTGTLSLNNGGSDFTGGVTVNAGTLRLGGSSSTEGPIIISGPVGTGLLTMASFTTLGVADGDSITLHNDIDFADTEAADGASTIDTGGGDLTLLGTISGGANLTKAGSGTLTLSGDNIFVGGLYVQAGTLLLGSSSDFIVESGEITSGPVGAGTTSGTIAGTLSLQDGTTLGVAPAAGPITLHNFIDVAGGESGVTIDTGNGALSLYGRISGWGDLTKVGGSNLNLYGDNTLTGDFYVGGGGVYFYHDHAAGLGTLELGGSSWVSFQTMTPTIHGLSATNSNDEVSLLAGSTLTINQTENTTFYGHVDAGTGASIVKDGAGRLVFAQDNSYSGTTTLAGGTLVAGTNGALGTSTVVFNGGNLNIANGVVLGNPLDLTNGGVLSGNGTIASAITAGNGVVLAPGDSPGNLTFSAGLTLASGSAISFQVQDANGPAGTGYDLITVSANVLNLTAAANTLTFNLVFLNSDGNDGTPGNFNPAGSYSWMFATAANPITGFNPNQFLLVTGGSSAGLPGTFSFTESGDQLSLFLNFTPVPEPSTYALLALGLGFLGLTVRRRRQA